MRGHLRKRVEIRRLRRQRRTTSVGLIRPIVVSKTKRFRRGAFGHYLKKRKLGSRRRIRSSLRKKIYLNEVNRVVSELNITKLPLYRYKRRSGYVLARGLSRFQTIVRQYWKRSSDIDKAELAAIEARELAIAAQVEDVGTEKDTTLSSFMKLTADDLIKMAAEKKEQAVKEAAERVAKIERDRIEAAEYKKKAKLEARKLKPLYENATFTRITDKVFMQDFRLKSVQWDVTSYNSRVWSEESDDDVFAGDYSDIKNTGFFIPVEAQKYYKKLVVTGAAVQLTSSDVGSTDSGSLDLTSSSETDDSAISAESYTAKNSSDARIYDEGVLDTLKYDELSDYLPCKSIMQHLNVLRGYTEVVEEKKLYAKKPMALQEKKAFYLSYHTFGQRYGLSGNVIKTVKKINKLLRVGGVYSTYAKEASYFLISRFQRTTFIAAEQLIRKIHTTKLAAKAKKTLAKYRGRHSRHAFPYRFTRRSRDYRFSGLKSVLPRWSKLITVSKQAVDRVSLSYNTDTLVAVPEMFYIFSYKNYLWRNFFFEEGGNELAYITRHTTFFDKNPYMNNCLAFKSFFFVKTKQDVSTKELIKLYADDLFKKAEVLKIAKNKNKATVCWGAIKRYWGYTIPDAGVVADDTIIGDMLKNFDIFCLSSANEFYKVFVLLLQAKVTKTC